MRRQNEKRLKYHYKVDEYVWIKVYDPAKGDDKLHGPTKIQDTRTNGTVVVVRNEIGNVVETYTIRKLEPYRGPAVDPRSRIVHQGEDQSDYSFAEEANRMAAYIVERSIAGGEEFSKPMGLPWMPSISH